MAQPDFTKVIVREEGKIIEEGISLTETKTATIVYVRLGKNVVKIRQPKNGKDWRVEVGTV